MGTLSSLELVEAACRGDVEAIEQLLLQYHPTLTRFARNYCATPQDVEDAVQEALWIAYQKIGTLRTAAAFVSWLFRIVRHQCYRLLRIKQREYGADETCTLDDVEANPESYACLKHDIVTALAGLPLHYREILLMRDVEGLTTPEVAVSLNLTIETVKSRLHRARKMLRQMLGHWRE